MLTGCWCCGGGGGGGGGGEVAGSYDDMTKCGVHLNPIELTGRHTEHKITGYVINSLLRRIPPETLAVALVDGLVQGCPTFSSQKASTVTVGWLASRTCKNHSKWYTQALFDALVAFQKKLA
jgi:hypothetical protein